MPKGTGIINLNEECSVAITIYPFHTQEVRDLAWTCFFPPLMLAGQIPGAPGGVNDCRPALTPARRLWLEQLDRDATPLVTHLSLRPTHRLGVYFEQLWHFFLQQDPDSELVAHNLPVHHEGRTLGEFDCIYYCHRRRQHVHLELAVKFYLAAPIDEAQASSGNARDWLGPNTQDRLDLKLDQLLGRQIQLGDNAHARALLDELGVGPLAREVAFKGYLFQPRSGHRPAPPGWNPERTFNEWLAPESLAHYCEQSGSGTYLILHRRQWLCNALSAKSADEMSSDQLQAAVINHFLQDKQPLLVAALDDDGHERTRFFIVPGHWPGQTP